MVTMLFWLLLISSANGAIWYFGVSFIVGTQIAIWCGIIIAIFTQLGLMGMYGIGDNK